jgi:putative transposase
MSHSLNNIWIHLIWRTKDHKKLITTEAEAPIYQYIIKQFEEMGCKVKALNGTSDHLHCLFRINPEKSIIEITKQMKGSSSHFINRQNLIPIKFSWQPGYASFSVSESGLINLTNYIDNQKIHHQKISFETEYQNFLRLNGLI